MEALLAHENQFGLQGFEVYYVEGTNKDSQGNQQHWRADSEERKKDQMINQFTLILASLKTLKLNRIKKYTFLMIFLKHFKPLPL